jgi:rhodanese-related sulfurtransferase
MRTRNPMKTTVAALTLALSAACVSQPGPERAANQPAGGAATGSVVPGVAPGVVDAEAARKLVRAGVKVVDVRTPAEFAAGHIPGAVNIPYDELARRAEEVGAPSAPVLLYCRTGRRSGIATETLRKLGFGEIYDLRAYDLWRASERSAAAR